MIDIVIESDKDKGIFKVYESSSDTLLITSDLGETFKKLFEHLTSSGLVVGDVLTCPDIRYHIDSGTFFSLIESNINLKKRLTHAPSGFTIAGQKFGGGSTNINNSKKNDDWVSKKRRSSGTFSKTSFNKSNKKFGTL